MVQKTDIICIGDSLTEGVVSANWVNLLQSHLPPSIKANVYNAGVGGDMAFNVVNRMDQITKLKADIAVILVGTNDICAHLSAKWLNWYIRDKELVEEPTQELFTNSITRIVESLKTADTKIVLCTIPPIADNLTASINIRAVQYNQWLTQFGQQNNIPIVDLYSAIAKLIPDNNVRHYDPDGQDYHTAIQLHASGLSWNEVSEKQQLYATTDFVHLNDTCAKIIAKNIANVVCALCIA